jgi:hypothetical protein
MTPCETCPQRGPRHEIERRLATERDVAFEVQDEVFRKDEHGPHEDLGGGS